MWRWFVLYRETGCLKYAGVARPPNLNPPLRMMQDQRSTHLWEYGG